MSVVTIMMAYYENPEMLRRHLAEWSMYDYADKQRVQFLIVDDGSPRHPAAPIVRVMNDGSISVRVLRIVDNIPWNQDGARNLGMRVARTNWVFMTDMDHVVPRDHVNKLINFTQIEARQGTYYMPAAQVKTDGTVLGEHPNTYLMESHDFWNCGGYDEDFAGWYGSDGNFRKNMRGLGLREVKTSAWHTIVYRKEDIFDACTHDFGRKDSPFYRAHNPALERKRVAPAYRARNHLRFDWFEETV